MYYKLMKQTLLLTICVLLSGCVFQPEGSIVNHYAEALLTKKNELQFRFKINKEIFTDQRTFKVRVSIQNEQLSSALGTNEIIYGQEYVYNGEYLEVDEVSGNTIYMDPIPLLVDLHTFELKDIIVNKNAVKVEVFSDQEILGEGYLTNFSTQL